MAEQVSRKDALKKLDAQLECSICLDTFKQPKLLPCFHVYCKSPCLEKLVARDGHSLICPTCRHIVPLSEKGVDGLQADFYIDRLFEIRDAFSKVAEPTETQCGNCGDGEATGYCQDCSELVCEECQANHEKFKKMKNHTIVTLNQLQTEVVIAPHKKEVARCQKHSNKKLKIYCKTCKELICSDCTVRLHKDHTYDLLADVFPKHKEELVSSLKPVREKLDIVEQALKMFEARDKDISDQRAALEAHIHKEIDQLHRLLDQRRAQLMSELDMLTQQKLKSLEAQRDQVEITQAKLTSCLEYAEGGLQTGTESEVLAMKAPVLKRIEQISAEFEPKTIQPTIGADISLTTDTIKQLQQSCLELFDITDGDPLALETSYITGDGLQGATIGEEKTMFHAMATGQDKQYRAQFNLQAELKHVKSKDRVQCEVVKQQNGQYKINYRPVKRGKHELHITVDGNPVHDSPFPIAVTPSAQSLNKPVKVVRGLDHPRGTALNSKGQIIVVENGKCISVLTPNGEKIRTFGTRGSKNGQLQEAWGVAVDKNDNIYVVDRGNYRIQKFTPNGDFVAAAGTSGSNQLQFNYAMGIGYNQGDNNLYVTDNRNNRIQVLTTDLKYVRTIGARGSGEGQFHVPTDVAFDDANNLYVTDYCNHRVQVLTTDGHFLRAFSQKAKGQALKNPHTIAIDSSNTVYVREQSSSRVSVFTSQGAYITTFGEEVAEEGKFTDIFGIFVDENDYVVVSDTKSSLMQTF